MALAVGGGVVTFIVAYYFSYWNVQVGYAPVQPVPFSHRLHAGQLGMDCRYCHANVERSPEAMVPPTQTCMGCHSVVRSDSASLRPVFESWETGEPVEWVRVHNLPDHAYFDHSIHLSAGVGCVSCHGRIDQMEVVTLQSPLSMSWCLDCHRDPEPNLRPVSEITNMAWEAEEGVEPEYARYVSPPETCSGCHR
ncbi:MAG: cytochrome c family protein [Myxococcota bacterium]|nr:cytochrome c family protein [Myxococcota bacterium]